MIEEREKKKLITVASLGFYVIVASRKLGSGPFIDVVLPSLMVKNESLRGKLALICAISSGCWNSDCVLQTLPGAYSD